MAAFRFPSRRVPVPPAASWFPEIGSAGNRRGYVADVQEFMRFAGLGRERDLARATPGDVEAWRDSLSVRVKPATVRRKLSSLSSLYRELVALGAVRASPVSDVGRPATGGEDGFPVLTAAQARRLLDAPADDTLKGLRDRAILAALLFQGLKSGEACGLRVGDVGREVLRVGGGRARELALHPETAARIDAYLELSGHFDGPLFRATEGVGSRSADRGLGPGTIYRVVVRGHAVASGIAAEVPGLSAHALRATAVQAALGDGAPVEAVQAWLGLSSVAAVSVYLHPAPVPPILVSFSGGRHR